jgi:hypothetical protein
MRSHIRLAVLRTAVFMMTLTSVAYAQGSGTTSSSLSGTVVDSSGAVIPGADVAVKNNGTSETFAAVTNQHGTFTVPALQPGSYAVTVSLTGFKTAVLSSVTLNAAIPTNVRVTLDVGTLAETVVVAGESASIVQTQSSAISTTMDINQVSNLPLSSRSALDVIAGLPGVNTPTTIRNSTVLGLPQSTINITIDGMSVQDNFLKTTDGFFARVTPRIDAVEEMTVTMAAQGADAAGQGAVQFRFVTRSGTNDFRGSGYYYLRHDALNTNTWFNNRDLPPDPATGKAPKTELIQHQPGMRVGGPIRIPGLFDGRNRAFFFVNYEEFRQPQKVTRNRTVLHPRAQAGIFRYNVNVGGQTVVREVDLLGLAAANGHTATADPTVAKLLADVRNATAMTGGILDLTDPSLQRFTFQNEQRSLNRYPTGRVDFNLTDRHRLSVSGNYQHIDSNPDTLNGRDPIFPGFPVQGTQDSTRYTLQGTVRSTLGATLVNEMRIGATGGATLFAKEIGRSMWDGPPLGNEGGFKLEIDTANISNPSSGSATSAREASTKVAENTLNWIKGNHSLSFGGAFTQADVWLWNQTHVPTIEFDLVNGDPADAMFSTRNFPGASSTQLNDAEDLYAVLTGRVSQIVANARLDENTGEYTFLGPARQRGRLRDLGFFTQDSWRVRPTLTLNFGLRYELQLPFYALNDSYSTATVADVWGASGVGNLFAPGTLTGKKPEFIKLSEGTNAYRTDWNNFAPNLGFAWTPSAETGLFRRLLGAEGDSVLRGGYSIAYSRHGMSDFTNVYGSNPGILIDASRSLSLGNLGALPVLFRDRNRLGAPAFPTTPRYPMSEVVTGDINIFDPNLQVPYAQTWTAGWQRKITGNTAVEARYVGARHLQGWTTYDLNEINIVESGFLDEFRLAQQNLQANLAAGRGSTFRYFGPGTGTAPLPIFLAYFSGLPSSSAGNSAAYTSALFRNSTFLNPLAVHYPQPHVAATALDADATRRRNALGAGLPANFLVTNPDLLGGANIRGNGGYTRYDSLQLEFRKRLSHGLQFQSSYTFGKAYISERYSFRTPRAKVIDTGVGDDADVPESLGSLTHALKANWVYDLPFGRGRRFGGNAGGFVDRLIGGWAFAGFARIQSGRLQDFGNVRLVGMTKDELGTAFKLRFDDANRVIYTLPQDIVDNTVKAFSVSATSPTGYSDLGPPSGRYLAPPNAADCVEVAINFGACGERSLIVTGPPLVRFDVSAVKRVRVSGRLNFEFRAEFLNALNTPHFAPVTGISMPNNILDQPFGSDPDDFRVTSADSGRDIQFVWRVSW